MSHSVDSLWTRLSILEARLQQESARRHSDPVRLGLLERMKTAIRAEIEAIKTGSTDHARSDVA